MIRYLSKTKKELLRGTAILRLDFNTEDDWRMRASLPTISYLLKRGAKVMIVSHRGRPTKFEKGLSLRRDALRLSSLLKKKVLFIKNFNFPEIRKKISNAAHGSVFVLENLRFLKDEEKNDMSLAKKLASVGDYYVNDAFAVSHRKNSSVAAITKYLTAYAGMQLESELSHLSKVMKSPKKPLVIVLGGAKISDKLGVIKNFKSKAKYFLLGGALANTLFYLGGLDVGNSAVEKKAPKNVRALVNYKKIVLPVDVRIKNKKWLDIGPKTEKLFGGKIKGARTVIWNGPMGLFEEKRFEKGTHAVGLAIASNKKAFTVVGGGETITALRKFKLDKKMNFVSTGGGAMLDFLSGKKLPGIESLKKQKR